MNIYIDGIKNHVFNELPSDHGYIELIVGVNRAESSVKVPASWWAFPYGYRIFTSGRWFSVKG